MEIVVASIVEWVICQNGEVFVVKKKLYCCIIDEVVVVCNISKRLSLSRAIFITHKRKKDDNTNNG